MKYLLILLLTLCPQVAVAANQMAGHPSPYLALHADDPVHWRSWNETVFSEARKDNRLVFLSIGYFSCHWCHVMQRESFKDETVAGVLNRHFVAVKIDRELDPDLDRRLMNFVEKVRGAAGWPLNVFLTPDGYPVTGFTYQPRGQFLDVLNQLESAWRENHAEYASAAKTFFESALQGADNQSFNAPQIPAGQLSDAFVSQTMLVADELQGGFGETSKFPSVPQLDALLRVIGRDPGLDPDVSAFVRLTLDSMARRNLHDHVHDGFFRYTTDPDWETPHFEKMLYDNAQLASLYLKAHQLWPEAGYADVALRTLEFVETWLKHDDGGYMSSLSAVDADNREGAAYLWTREQLESYLDAAELARLDQLWPGKTRLGEFLVGPLIGNEASDPPGMDRRIRARLRTRAPDIPVDDKRLAAWNAMMLEALTLAARHDDIYSKRADRLYRYMRRAFLRADGSLRRLAGNDTVAAAVLEDYAQLAHAFLRYGQAFGDSDAIAQAAAIAGRAHELFVEDGRWRQKTDNFIPLDAPQWIIPDRVFFSPMTLWLQTALSVDGLDPAVRASAESMLLRASRDMLDSPYFYGSYILLRITRGG